MTTNDILIETRRYGAILRVMAIHAGTGTEVVFQVPLKTDPSMIKKLAANKMRYVLNKK